MVEFDHDSNVKRSYGRLPLTPRQPMFIRKYLRLHTLPHLIRDNEPRNLVEFLRSRTQLHSTTWQTELGHITGFHRNPLSKKRSSKTWS